MITKIVVGLLVLSAASTHIGMARNLKPITVKESAPAGQSTPGVRGYKIPDSKPSSDPSKAGTRENLNTTFGAPNEDK